MSAGDTGSVNRVLLAAYALMSGSAAASMFAWAAARCAAGWRGEMPPAPPAVMALALVAGLAVPFFVLLACQAGAPRADRPIGEGGDALQGDRP